MPKAVQDRQLQLDWIALNNYAAADKQGQHIDHQLDQLTHFPKLGRKGRRPGTRELVIAHTPFIAVYRIRPGHIDIIRLFHSSRKTATPPLRRP